MVVPPQTRFDQAAAGIRVLLAAGTRVGAVLVGATRLFSSPTGCPPRSAAFRVIDQVDSAAAASCTLLAVEVRPPGHPLTTLADPVALGAAFGLGERDAR